MSNSVACSGFNSRVPECFYDGALVGTDQYERAIRSAVNRALSVWTGTFIPFARCDSAKSVGNGMLKP